jgi:radical SAM superfamily enzyme YgiQ (UPF0313 family)
MVKRKKILIINPPIRVTEQPAVFPSGLGYIAAHLIREGYDVKVLDINGYRYNKETVEKILKKYLVEGQTEIVGIGCLITCYEYVKWLIQMIRKMKPGIKIIVGGGIGSSIPEMVIEKLKADVAVIGEGEKILVNLLKALEKNKDLKKVRGICFKKKGKIIRTLPEERIKNLDELSFPAWHLFPMDVYLNNEFQLEGVMDYKDKKSMNVIAGRGCPYQCTFCYETYEHRVTMRSTKNVIEEVKILQKDYGVELIYFVDDLFAMNKGWIMEFCDLLLREKIKLIWLCTARVNLVDKEMVKKMKDAGCILLNFGIESGSQKMLEIMRKGASVEQASNAIRICRNAKMRIGTSFMMGFPEETKETLDETIKFCIKNDMHLTSIFFVTPYPGTPLYEQVKRMGLIKNEEEYISRLGNATEFTINLTKWDDNGLFKMRNYVLSTIHWGYYRKHKLEYGLWLRKKLIWYLVYIQTRGLHAFLNEAKKKVTRTLG